MSQHRLHFALVASLASVVACDATVDGPTRAVSALAGSPGILRIVAANLSSGSGQDYDPGHGARILQGLAADVVLIQEFNYGDNSSGDLRTFVDQTFGTDFVYYREGGNEQIPNGVISRYPILDAGEWNDSQISNRDFAWARIDIPGPTHLWAVSVHLKSGRSSTQSAEARALVSYVQSQVPAGDFVVIGGDLNTTSRGAGAVQTLAQIVDTSGPYPVDQAGNGHTNANRNRPYDWVLPSAALSARRVPVQIGGQSHPSGLVVDTRVYSPISALSPALASDSAASGMQHMAVVLDFAVDAEAPADAGVADAGFEDAGSGAPDGGTAASSVFLNEILANEPGSDSAGEFVELVNGGAGDVDISGWQLSDAVATRHTFPSGTVLEAGHALVVFGGGSAIPSDLDNAVAASSGALGFSNGGDTVTLTSGGQVVDAVAYGSALSGVDGVSMNRDPDGDPGAQFVLHTAFGSSSSPGRQVDGSPFGGAPVGPPVLFLNEVLANEPGSNVAGEFVEIVNLGGAADIGGYRLSDGAAVRHVFASGTTLGTNEAIVVYGGASAIPGGFSAVAASSGALGLSNGGDAVTLDDGQAVVDSLSYSSALSGSDGVSMNRNPDGTPGASLVLHTTFGAPSSPGVRADGGAFGQ